MNKENLNINERRGGLIGCLNRLVRFRKWFFHDIMGWHNCKGGNGSFDGCSMHAKCSCGKDVMQDSQGNWF